jgi:hypothetical protein
VKSGLTTADNSFHQDTEKSQYAEKILSTTAPECAKVCNESLIRSFLLLIESFVVDDFVRSQTLFRCLSLVAGIAGEAVPRIVFPALVGHARHPGINVGDSPM